LQMDRHIGGTEIEKVIGAREICSRTIGNAKWISYIKTNQKKKKKKKKNKPKKQPKTPNPKSHHNKPPVREGGH